jgi:hypothetical protein
LFETTHHKEETRQFMAGEREALAFMLVVWAYVVIREEASVAEEAAAEAAAMEEMVRVPARWDEDMARARRGCKHYKLANEGRHHIRL